MKHPSLFPIFIATAITLLLLFFVLPKPDFSERENRRLATEISFRGGIENSLRLYASDRFPLRDAAISLAAETERLLGLSESGGVLIGERLAERLDRFDASVAKENIVTVNAISKHPSIPIFLAVIPRPSDYKDGLPALYQNPSTESAFRFIRESTSINTDTLFSADDYYKTDHHLTLSGTEKLYRAICNAWGIEEKTPVRAVSVNGFYGSAFRRSGLSVFPPDSFSYPEFEDENSYSAVASGKAGDALYHTDYLQRGDKYAFFFGGNYGRLDIKKKNDESRKRLLVIKDSYANALLPYLCRDYDITAIDPRYFNGDIDAVIKEICPAEILVTVGADTLQRERFTSLLSENSLENGTASS